MLHFCLYNIVKLKLAAIGNSRINAMLLQTEGEIQSLTRRVRLLEEDYEHTSTRLHQATEKLDEALKAADESERFVN